MCLSISFNQLNLMDLRDTIDVPQDGSGVQYYQGKEL